MQGYPTDRKRELMEEATGQYIDRIGTGEHQPGKNWIQDEPRDHVFKACDELFQARDYAQNGDKNMARVHFANALNHMLFALDIIHENNE